MLQKYKGEKVTGCQLKMQEKRQKHGNTRIGIYPQTLKTTALDRFLCRRLQLFGSWIKSRKQIFVHKNKNKDGDTSPKRYYFC